MKSLSSTLSFYCYKSDKSKENKIEEKIRRKSTRKTQGGRGKRREEERKRE